MVVKLWHTHKSALYNQHNDFGRCDLDLLAKDLCVKHDLPFYGAWKDLIEVL